MSWRGLLVCGGVTDAKVLGNLLAVAGCAARCTIGANRNAKEATAYHGLAGIRVATFHVEGWMSPGGVAASLGFGLW